MGTDQQSGRQFLETLGRYHEPAGVVGEGQRMLPGFHDLSQLQSHLQRHRRALRSITRKESSPPFLISSNL